MNSEWMGRYRPLMAALVAHGNIVTRMDQSRRDIGDGVMVNATEWQILESIIEHRFETLNMNEMCRNLGIPQSSFSKTVKMLCGIGLVEKYQAKNNKKNIILKPSDRAIELYDKYSVLLNGQFEGFFRELENVSDEDIAAVVRAIGALDATLMPPAQEEETVLIKKE